MLDAFALAFTNALSQRRLQDDTGASLVEYALLLALIALVCVVAVTFLGTSASESFSSSTSSMYLGN